MLIATTVRVTVVAAFFGGSRAPSRDNFIVVILPPLCHRVTERTIHGAQVTESDAMITASRWA
jgi:hypothetical protein